MAESKIAEVPNAASSDDGQPSLWRSECDKVGRLVKCGLPFAELDGSCAQELCCVVGRCFLSPGGATAKRQDSQQP